MIATLFIIFALLILLGTPIAFAMSGSALLTIVLLGDIPLSVIVQKTFKAGSSFSLLAIPFFVLAGEVMTASRMTGGLVRLCDALVGHVRSALASVSILACMVFAGISGSGVADTAAIGTVMIPQLIQKGYPRGRAAAIIAAGGALGPIIPPSLLMIIYGSIAELSVGALFLSGAIPGIIMGIGLILTAYIWNIRGRWESGSGQNFSTKRLVSCIPGATLPLITPVIIIGGIVGGIFTATEAGVIAAVYALVAAFASRNLPIKELKEIFVRAMLTSTLSLFIISMASIFGWILAIQHFPQIVQAFLLEITRGNQFLAAVLILSFLVALGFVVEVISIMIIFTPILAPLGPALGYDPIHWGLLQVLAINMGGVTPPVATHLYVSASIAECRLGEVSRHVMPLTAVMYAVLLLVLLFPDVAMFLPQLFFH
jgi:C4-dicarboxylate transporter DctM subunit